jgi:hypothetical protein
VICRFERPQLLLMGEGALDEGMCTVLVVSLSSLVLVVLFLFYPLYLATKVPLG